MNLLAKPTITALTGFFLFISTFFISDEDQSGTPEKGNINPWSRSRAYIDTAWNSLYNDPEKTLVYANKLLSLAERENLIRPKSSAHSLMGLYYETSGDYEKAIAHYHKAIDVLAPHDSLRQFMSSPYANISIVYHYSENYRKAIEYRKKAVALDKEFSNQEDLVSSYSALANFYKKLEMPDSSLYYFHKTLEYEDEFPAIASLTYGNLGDIYIQRQQWDSALYAFQRNYHYVYENPSSARFAKVDANYDLAGYYLLRGEFPQALPFLQTALQMADSLDNNEFKADILKLYSRYHEGVGNYQDALDYYKKARLLRDSITGADVQSTIAELEAKYQNQKKSTEIAQLKTTSQLKDLMIEKQDAQNDWLAVFIAAIGVILALIIILYFSLRRKSKKLKEQNEVIRQSHQDIQDLMRESHHRIKNNLQVVSSLLKMQSKNAETPQARHSLMEAYNRIKTIAMMHQRLQGSHTFKTVNMHEFLTQLTDSIKKSLLAKGSHIEIVADVDKIEMETDRSIAIGLVVNEAVTNSLKYAFIDGKGQIRVDMHHRDNMILLEICDNGQGFPKGFDPEKDSNLGFRIIRSLTTKLNGNLAIEERKGLSVNITFPSKIST